MSEEDLEKIKSEVSQLQGRLLDIELTLEKIKERNTRVELDKRWETSLARHLLIITLTYLITATVFHLIGVEQFLRNAFVPTVGFYLSTLSLPLAKRFWIKNQNDE